TRWGVMVPAGLEGTEQPVVVTDASGAQRTATVRLPSTGSVMIDYSAMARAVTATVQTAPRLVVVGMPHGGAVAVASAVQADATWLDQAMTRWGVKLAPELAGAQRLVVVADAQGVQRNARVDIPARGDAEVTFSAMTLVQGERPQGRVVLRGAPANVEART